MKNLTIFIFLIISTQLFSQPNGLSSEIIRFNKIRNIVAYLDMESDDPNYEGLEIQNFEFDNKGRCTRKKYIFPFYDVVTTSDEYFIKYNKKNKVVEQKKVHRTEILNDNDKSYIGLFGETNIITINLFEYNSDYFLQKEIEFKIGSNDTLVSLYHYSDSMLTSSTHFSTLHKGSLNPNNFSRKYYYDKLGRLTKTEEYPETQNTFSTTMIIYEGNSNLRLVEKTFNDFDWISVYEEGMQISQDSLLGELTKYKYDENRNLIKKTFYSSLIDLENNYYGYNYIYEHNLMIEEQAFNKTKTVINLTDKIQYIYDSKGILREEKMIYNGELKFSYRFKSNLYD